MPLDFVPAAVFSSCRHTIVKTNHQAEPNENAEDSARLKALREAAQSGIADIEVGRFHIFATPAQLARHLGAIVDKVVGDSPSS